MRRVAASVAVSRQGPRDLGRVVRFGMGMTGTVALRH
jgi:hypothetical protein